MSLGSRLWALAPRRLVLIGPDGPILRAALVWARQCADVTIVRGADHLTLCDGDLIVSQRGGVLPARGANRVSALIPAGEAAVAGDRGWIPVGAPIGDALLVAHEAPSAERQRPGFGAYTRARLSTSQTLDALFELTRRDENGRSRAAHHQAASANSALGTWSAAGVQAQPGARRHGPPSTRARTTPVSIVIPVYNAASELRRCLYSVALHTTWPAELLLIDDASTQAEVGEVLDEAAGLSHVRIIRNAVNLGFTGAVNRALRLTTGDVVLLNSDTEVGPRWLEHLVRAASEAPGVASVTAVSDNAGAFSVPRFGEPNPIPLSLDVAQAARLIAQSGANAVPAPTGSGFCLFIPRRALDVLGAFDAEMFPRGYGEENDFCMRAGRAGWKNLIDGRTFVHHVREASFGSERAELAAGARRRLDARYPEYTELIREFASGPPMQELRSRVERAFARGAHPRPRLLFVIHEGGGGTWVANLELVRALEEDWEPFVFTSDRRTLRLWRVEDGELLQLRAWTLARSIRVMDFSRDDYREVMRTVLIEWEIELVHVRHLIKHTFDAPRVAAELGVPVVFSFHDFYFACPTVNLLDDHHVYCAAQCTPGDGACHVPAAGLDGLPHLKHNFVFEWREEVEAMLRDVDAFATTSRHARSIHRKALPVLGARRFELIEHGRTLSQRGGIAAAPLPGKPIRILVVANLDVHKGADYLRALRESDRLGRLELHLVGAVPERYSDLGVTHGTVAAEELFGRAKGIRPAFVGSFSIAPETYSHSLTEAWAIGVPVIATDIGAHGERIRDHGGGLLLPLGDPAEAVRRIISVADDPTAYERLRAQATLRGCATVADMTGRYASLYRRTIEDRRPLVAVPGSRAPAQLRRGIIDLHAFVPGTGGVHPGSTYVRVLQRYRHPGMAAKLSLSLATADDVSVPCGDLLLVQRTALPPEATEGLLASLRERGIPLILELDDHLLVKGDDDPAYGSYQSSLAALVAAADLVLVATDALADALRGRARAIAVVPNLIDERLFLAGLRDRPTANRRRSGPVQLVYVGSPTHGRDLGLLAPVMSELERRRPGGFELNVVGVEPPGPDQDWYRRVTIPDSCKPYPLFVGWLREQRPGWDIGLSPLADEEFNRYKSDLKFLEYGALGLAGVFSESAPYSTVEHGRTGLKAGEEVEAWVEALLTLSDDDAQRERIAGEAFRYVASQRLMRHGTAELLALLHSLSTSGTPQTDLIGTGLVSPMIRSL